MIGRSIGLAAALLATFGIAAAALAGVRAGPRLAFLRFTERPDAIVLATGDPSLGEITAVAGGGSPARPLPYPPSGPAWSPDGATIAFSGVTGPLPGLLRPERRRIYLVDAAGGGVRPVVGTRGGFAPVFSSDGTSVAFARSVRKTVEPEGLFGGRYWRGTSVWTVGLDGGRRRQLTEWQNGVEDLPSSFSPDGSVLALTHRDAFRDRADATALRLDEGDPHLLVRDAAWPRYSPDGSRIAFLGIQRVGDTACCEKGDGFSVDLYAMDADRSSRTQLTDTPGKAERPASWDPSGERLVYTTKSAPTGEATGELEAAVMEINADGSCRSRISVSPPRGRERRLSFLYPAWQPGLGREAGRIAC